MHTFRHAPSRASAVGLAALLTLSVVAAACGGTTKSDADKGPTSTAEDCLNAKCGESGLKDAGTPKRGGTIIYGLEGETNGGFCLPEAQLAISGELVVRAIYDTLTVPNAAGGYTPYLAKSVTPSTDYKTWKIVVRDGVKFHDGTDLTGEVVKNNLDAYRGTYPGRAPLLFKFTLQNIDTVTADGQTVTVTTKVPWIAFPAFLFSGSRMGIMAQAQLDDSKSCDRKLIGTGPFEFKSWSTGDKLVGVRNPNYWQTAPDGKSYPYANGIEFRIIADGQVRLNSIKSPSGANVIHTSNAEQIGGDLLDLRNAGKTNMLVSEDAAEPTFIQLNSTKPPFDDIRMRKALAQGLDRKELNQVQNNGLPTVASGPFAPSSEAFVADPGYPAFDLEAAKKLVKEYVADGGKNSFTLVSGPDAATMRFAQLIQQRALKIGLKVKIVLRDQAAGINDAIGKKYQAMLFRNFPGGDPDINYVWWYGQGNPVNFSGYDDATINKLLDEGRSETDPTKRTELYKQINNEFAKQVWSLWTWFTPWAVVEKSNIHNILGPPLPGDDPSQPGEASTTDKDLEPSAGLANGHSLIGMWIDS
ncbi:ABC transporter substrate-binding protein [Aquihabitans sp. McL0605]|uniref:ABC transporter substrate-binding protein n=1 Tax=Aquihabitans sp. McL0605 TaxID=3415671 RepID=UPI003CE736E7